MRRFSFFLLITVTIIALAQSCSVSDAIGYEDEPAVLPDTFEEPEPELTPIVDTIPLPDSVEVDSPIVKETPTPEPEPTPRPQPRPTYEPSNSLRPTGSTFHETEALIEEEQRKSKEERLAYERVLKEQDAKIAALERAQKPMKLVKSTYECMHPKLVKVVLRKMRARKSEELDEIGVMNEAVKADIFKFYEIEWCDDIILKFIDKEIDRKLEYIVKKFALDLKEYKYRRPEEPISNFIWYGKRPKVKRK
jgi:hypothetical protein